MRDASTVAKSTSQPRAGVFAELSNPLPADGIGAPSRWRGTLIALALATVVLLALAPSAMAASPSITGTAIDWASITSTSAEVKAEINPNGEGTSYKVEYLPQAQYVESGYAGASVAPAGIAGVGSGTEPVTKGQALGALTPATAYRFRFTATNDSGTTKGEAIIFRTFPVEPQFSGCSNGALRVGVARLPECRAYEQASPVDKRGANVQNDRDMTTGSPTGNAITFGVGAGLPTNGGTSRPTLYMAKRGAQDWSTIGLRPATEVGGLAEIFGLSPDFSTSFSTSKDFSGEFVVLGDTATSTWSRVAQAGTGPGFGSILESRVGGFAAADPEHVLVESESILAPGSVKGEKNLYDLDHGVVTNAGRVPVLPATECDDESGPACVSTQAWAGPYNWSAGGNLNEYGGATGGYYMHNTIAADGEKIFFTQVGTGRLFMRENNSRTVQISASQRAIADPNGEKPAAFLAATVDGSKAFFLSCEKLTENSTAVSTVANSCTESENFFAEPINQGQDLYEYDTETGELTDLTVDPNVGDPLRANVVGMLGASEDGSIVYFAASGVLAPGATPGSCTRMNNVVGACNVYVSQDGVISLVARLAGVGQEPGDGDNWQEVRSNGPSNTRASRVAADGTLIFTTRTKLSAYDNQEAPQIYRYQPGDDEPLCVSCPPTLAPPINLRAASLASQNNNGEVFLKAKVTQRNVSADGSRVFFETTDALVPADINGNEGCGGIFGITCRDVYMWEATGTGSCESNESNDGCLYLMSSGTSPNAAYYGDNSLSGDDVFIFTSDQLVPQDKDELADSYDVRVAGGLAGQHPAPPLPPCEGEACRGPISATPPANGAGTGVFEGPGNPTPKFKTCPKGKKLNEKEKCVRKKSNKKNKKSKKRAGRKHGGAK